MKYGNILTNMPKKRIITVALILIQIQVTIYLLHTLMMDRAFMGASL